MKTTILGIKKTIEGRAKDYCQDRLTERSLKGEERFSQRREERLPQRCGRPAHD